MESKPEIKKPTEKELRVRLLEMGLKQKDVALALNITKQDVSMVICGRSKTPSYKTKVYKYLGFIE